MAASAPRVFGIVASEAPIVAVIRRGPTEWCHLGRWDLTVPSYEPGAWLHGVIAPQKCDLSPDGRWFAASIHKPNAHWEGGQIYESISRLPWLTSLAAWEMGTTYTLGIHFTSDRACALGDPDAGDLGPCLERYGVALNDSVQFRVERARGWLESDDTPPREAGGPFDEQREVTMRRMRPGGDTSQVLEVSGSYAGFRSSPDAYTPTTYVLHIGDEPHLLGDVQWADWSHDGRLLVATTEGHLQIRAFAEDGTASITFDVNLASMTPDPKPPPAWASTW